MRFKKFLYTFLIMTLVLACMPVSVFAAATKLEDYIKAETGVTPDNNLSAAAESVIGNNENLYKTKFQENSAYKYQVSLGSGDSAKTVYVRELTAKRILEQYQISQAGVSGYSEVDDAKAQVKTMTEGLNLQGDIGTATQALGGFQGIISTIVGIIIVMITILMVLTTTCDICYITLPMFRESQDTNNKGWNSVINKLITQEARYSVKTCSMDSGKNPLAMYLSKRVVSYILLAIALFVLLTGNISLIIDIVLTAISGIIDALKSLGGAV